MQHSCWGNFLLRHFRECIVVRSKELQWVCQAETYLNRLVRSQTSLLRTISVMWEDALAPSKIHPILSKCCEIPCPNTWMSPLEHKGLLVCVLLPASLTTVFLKARISCSVQGWCCWPGSCWVYHLGSYENEIAVSYTGLSVLLQSLVLSLE